MGNGTLFNFGGCTLTQSLGLLLFFFLTVREKQLSVD